jgi:hypothetical protein
MLIGAMRPDLRRNQMFGGFDPMRKRPRRVGKVNAYGGGELNNAAMYSKSVTARGKYRRKECLHKLGLISKAYENIKKLR